VGQERWAEGQGVVMFLHRGWTASGLISVVWKIGFGFWRRGLGSRESRHMDMQVCGVGRKGIKVTSFYTFFLHFFTFFTFFTLL